MEDAAKLREAIEASGLSARRFAVEVLSRDERTIRRWLAGEVMPPVVRAWLDRVEAIKPARTGRLHITLGPVPQQTEET